MRAVRQGGTGEATGTQLRVLIVEDNEDDARLLLRELARGGYEVTHQRVETLEALAAAMASAAWDLVVSDFALPAMTAIDVLGALGAADHDVPCVVISGSIEEDAAAEVFRAGARDFVVKDRMTRLVPAIARELGEAQTRRERREAERALLETRERMQVATETIGIGIWEIEPASGVMVWSGVMERLHGLAGGRSGGRVEDWLALMHPEDRARVAAQLTAWLRDRTDLRIEYRIPGQDGVRWIAAIGRARPDTAGRPARAVGVSIDITAQKQLEEQLRLAQKLEGIGQLAGGVAHDFNNLLTAILGFAHLLSEDMAPDDPGLHAVREIRKAGERGAGLTRQLLAFSRQQVLQPALVNLNTLVTETGQMLARLIGEHIEMDTALEPDLAPVLADGNQIEQIIINLAVNARDAMPGGGTLRVTTANVDLDEAFVRTHPVVRAGRYVRLSVADTGIGMNEETRRRIFEPFFTTKALGKGTGLGLATVYGIVKQSGGYIWVSSEEGRGATFDVYLPRAEGAAAPPRPAPERGGPLVGSERLLVVEDQRAVRELARIVLERAGYRVIEAAGADEAEAAFTDEIDLVITDVIMPGGTGPALVASLSARRPGLRALYMSGYADDIVRQEGRLETRLFLQKPFTKATLLRKVREALDA